MTEYELLTQGARHPLLNGTDTAMTINRYGFGREHTNMVGSPAIVGCADGEYVRHDDHVAIISELQAELAEVEHIVVAQTVTIAELRVDHSGGANDMVSAPVAAQEPVARYCPGCGSVGPDEGKYRDCCPDGGEARVIPKALAEKCHDTFNFAIRGMMAEQAANDTTPQPPTGAQLAVSAESALNEDAIYLGCARMGLAEASDDEVLSFVRIAKQRAVPTPPPDDQVRPVCRGCMALRSGCGKCSRCKAEIAAQPSLGRADKVDAQPSDGDDTANQWRKLALQFDGHRMQALWHLKTLLEWPQTHAEIATAFLSAPPLSGEDVLAERIAAMATPAQPDPAMAGEEWSDKEITALSRVMLAGKRTANMVAFARKLLAHKRVQPASGNCNCSVCHPYNCYGCDPCKPASGEDARDAARYRFAAKHCVLGGGVYKFNWPIAPVGKKQFDKYLDAAMQQERQP